MPAFGGKNMLFRCSHLFSVAHIALHHHGAKGYVMACECPPIVMDRGDYTWRVPGRCLSAMLQLSSRPTASTNWTEVLPGASGQHLPTGQQQVSLSRQPGMTSRWPAARRTSGPEFRQIYTMVHFNGFLSWLGSIDDFYDNHTLLTNSPEEKA